MFKEALEYCHVAMCISATCAAWTTSPQFTNDSNSAENNLNALQIEILFNSCVFIPNMHSEFTY